MKSSRENPYFSLKITKHIGGFIVNFLMDASKGECLRMARSEYQSVVTGRSQLIVFGEPWAKCCRLPRNMEETLISTIESSTLCLFNSLLLNMARLFLVYLVKMVSFNSYVSLPEGRLFTCSMFWNICWTVTNKSADHQQQLGCFGNSVRRMSWASPQFGSHCESQNLGEQWTGLGDCHSSAHGDFFFKHTGNHDTRWPHPDYRSHVFLTSQALASWAAVA